MLLNLKTKKSDEDGIAVKKEKAPFVPTATKKELVSTISFHHHY